MAAAMTRARVEASMLLAGVSGTIACAVAALSPRAHAPLVQSSATATRALSRTSQWAIPFRNNMAFPALELGAETDEVKCQHDIQRHCPVIVLRPVIVCDRSL